MRGLQRLVSQRWLQDSRTALWLAMAAVPSLALEQNPVQMETPIGGWRGGSGTGEHFQQQVHYPASSVNTPEDQDKIARIRGAIEAAPKTPVKAADGPAKLIVNGVSMPLKLDEDGHFDRPFSFPNGSNSVEVRSNDGQQRRRVQFYKNSNGATPAKLRILLSWDSDHTDLDLHVVCPDGAHIWYGNRVAPNGGALDVDVTTGYGPEIFASPTPLKGQYLVYVNYFGGGYSSDESGEETPAQALTTAQVTLISQEGTPDEKIENFIIPMRQPGELTLVKRFSYP